jgi:hypothetical protein
MGVKTRIATRQAGMTGSLMGIFGLYKATLEKEKTTLSVFDAVYAYCVLIIISLGYYCVGKFLLAACYPQNRYPPRKSGITAAQYLGVHRMMPGGSNTTEVVSGVPRLTIQNVWMLVYGLGLVFFVTGYCMIGLHPVCLACGGLAMGVLGIEELACPRVPLSPAYTSLRIATLLTGLVSLTLVSADFIGGEVMLYAKTLDLYSIFFGLCLPFVSQFIMATVRESRHYALGTILEVCEFGFPFTAFLAIFHLGVAYGQRFQLDTEVVVPPFDYGALFNQSLDYYYWYHKNQTAQGVLRADGPYILFFGIVPLLAVPSVVCYVACVIEGNAIDPLLSLSLALCVQHLIHSPLSSLGIYGTVCCCAAGLIRILTEYQPQATMHRPNLQMESNQLSERALQDFAARRKREMQEAEEILAEEERIRLNPDGDDGPVIILTPLQPCAGSDFVDPTSSRV